MHCGEVSHLFGQAVAHREPTRLTEQPDNLAPGDLQAICLLHPDIRFKNQYLPEDLVLTAD